MPDGLCREQRVDLQQFDDGDPEDTVVVSRKTNRADTYHDDADCRHFNRDTETRTISRVAAQRRWLHPCVHCVLDDRHELVAEVRADGGEERV